MKKKLFSLKHVMRHLLNTRIFLYAVMSTENSSCLPALEVPSKVCGLGSLRTTSLFATSHISATLGNAKPSQYDFRKNFTSNSTPTLVIIPTYIAIGHFSVENLHSTKSLVCSSFVL